MFEYFRKDLKWPAYDAWVIAPSNGFNRIGGSNARGFGPTCSCTIFTSANWLAQIRLQTIKRIQSRI